MKSNPLNRFNEQNIAWVSWLPIRETQEVFAQAFEAMQLAGWIAQTSESGRWTVFDPEGTERMVVTSTKGILTHSDGCEPFFVLMRAMTQYPEAIKAGFQDGKPIHPLDVTLPDVLDVFQGRGRRYLGTLSRRAALINAISLPEAVVGYPQMRWDKAVDNSVHNGEIRHLEACRFCGQPDDQDKSPAAYRRCA